jgi:hypothetical protein
MDVEDALVVGERMLHHGSHRLLIEVAASTVVVDILVVGDAHVGRDQDQKFFFCSADETPEEPQAFCCEWMLSF